MAALIGKAKAVSEEYNSALADLTFNSKPMINVLTMLAEENNDHGQVIVQVICDRIKKVGVDQKMPSLYLLDSILKNIGGDYVPIISRYIVDVFCHTFEAAIDERKRMQLFKLRNTWTQYIPAKSLYDLDVRINRTDPNWPVIAQTNTPKEGALPPGPSPKVHINPKFLAKTDANNPLGTSIAVTIAAAIGAEDAAVLRKQRLLEEEKRVQEQLKLLQAQKLKREREQHELALKRQQVEREKLLAEQRRQLELLRKQQQTMTDRNKNPSSVNTESSSKIKSELQEESNSKDPRKIESSGAKDPRLIRNIEKQADSPKLGKSVTQLKSGGKSAVSVVNKIMTNMNVKKTKPSFVTQKSPPGRRHPQSFSDIHERKLNKSPVFSKKEQGVNNIQNMPGNIPTKNTQASNSNHLTRIMNSMEQTFLPEPTVDSKLPNAQSRPSVQTRIVTELTKPFDENIEVNPEKTDPSKQTELQQMKNLPNSILANPEAKHQLPAPHQALENKPRPPVLSKACAPQVTAVPRPRPTVPQMTPLVPTIEEVKIAQAVALARTGPPPVPPRQISPAFPQLSNLNSVDMQIAAQAAAIATAIHQLQSVNQTVNQLQTTNLIQNSTQPQPVNQTINPQQSAELAAKLIQLVSSQPALLSQPNEPEPPPPGVSPDTVKASLAENKKRSPTPPAKEGPLQRDKQEGRRAELKERRRDNVVRDAREIAKERRELREKEAMRQAEVRDREVMKKENREINSREREIRGHDRNKMRDIRPERSRDRSPYRSRNERDSAPRSGSPGYNRTRTEDRITAELQVKERIDGGRPEHKDEPPLKKIKESDDVQERSRKARARSPSRYWFRMERKIETEKRVEEKEKELHLQRARKDSGGDTTEFHKTSSPRGRPYMRKPDDVSSAQWFNYKKDRKKEFRYIKSRLLDIRRDIRDGIPDLNINVLKEHRIEVNQKLKKGDISKEQYDELCQLMDNIENAHRYKINNDHESYRHMEGQIPPGGGPYGPRDFHPRHPQGFDGLRRPSLPFRHDERFPPPPRSINDALYQERHTRPPFQQQHPNDQRFSRPAFREPFPHPRDGPPAPGPRIENRPPFQPVMGPQSVERPPPGHLHERPPPGHPHERPPPGHPHERPPLGHPHNRPPPGHPHVRPPAGNLHERPPPGHPLEMPPPGHRLERPPPRHPLERPPLEPLRPPFPMDLRDTYQENRFPPPRPFMHEPQHPGPNQFPQQGMGPAPAGYSGVDLRPPFVPVDQQSQPSNMQKILPGFQNFLPSENFQQQAPDSNSPIDVSALLGKLLAHGIKVEKKETDLNVPAINLNMEELRKRHEGAINQLFQGVQCSSCGHRFPLNAKAQYSEHLDWHFRQNRKEKDGIRKVSSRTWFYDLHDWIEQNQRPVADDGKVQSAFFEAERSTKTDETTDAVVTQSDTKKSKTKDQTIPVFAEDGDGTCEICCEPLEQYWDEDAEEWRYRKAVREDSKTYHQACFEDYIPYEYEEESRPQSPSSLVQSSDDKPQVEAHEQLLKTSDDQEVKITENPEGKTADIEVKEEIFIENTKMETDNAEFKKEVFIENTYLEKSEEVSEISDSNEIKTETPGEADPKLTPVPSSEDKTNVTMGDQVDKKLEIVNEQTNNHQTGNIKEETCEKEENIVKEELPVNEVENKSGNEATQTIVKDG